MRLSAAQLENQFAAWLAEHGAILHKLSRAYAGDGASRDELYQEMRLQLWRSMEKFGGEAKASTWIYRVCLNTALTWRRSQVRRTARVVAAPDQVASARSNAPGPADVRERSDLIERLHLAVKELPPVERSLVVLALDGLSYREISDVTGMTENHVGVVLSRARKKLTLNLKEISHEL